MPLLKVFDDRPDTPGVEEYAAALLGVLEGAEEGVRRTMGSEPASADLLLDVDELEVCCRPVWPSHFKHCVRTIPVVIAVS